jgi:hypothetical protein
MKQKDKDRPPVCRKCGDVKGLVNFGKGWKCVNPNCRSKK